MKARGTSQMSLFLLGLCNSLLMAQPPDTLWTRTFGGAEDDRAYWVEQTSDQGYVVAGYTRSFGAGNADFYLLRLDSVGNTLWMRTYGSASLGEEANCVRPLADGGYVLAGTTFSGSTFRDFLVTKTDSSGDTIWTRTYGGPGSEGAYSVEPTTGGGFVVAGFTGSFGAGITDFYLVKANDSGDTIWTRTYGGSRGDWAYSVQQTTDGGYAVAGMTESLGAGGWDAYLVKTDSLGDTLWTHTYGGSDNDLALSVQHTIDGGYILAGRTRSLGAGAWDAYVVKTDSLGDTLWTRAAGGTSSDGAFCVRQTVSGGYAIAGYTDSFGMHMTDFYLVRMSGSGQMLWTSTIGVRSNNEAYSLQQTTDGGYIVAGGTWDWQTQQWDCYLVKMGSDQSDTAPVRAREPSQYALYPNYPNPFNPTTTIAYDLTQASHISLCVFDLLGREVAVLQDGVVNAGSHRVTFDGSNLESGIYFARLEAGSFSQTKKLMLLK